MSDDSYAVKRVGRGVTWWEDREGKLHRADGPARESDTGVQEWYWHGERHRTDGPALISAAGKRWYRNGKLHREDGPAIEERSAARDWYRNGRKLTREQIEEVLKRLQQVRAGEELAEGFLKGSARSFQVRSIKKLKKGKT